VTPPLAVVALEGDLDQALAAIPALPGVGQILGPEGRNLLIGRASNLRRWSGSHLGMGRTPPGRRPRTNLRPLATAVAHAVTGSAFQQRLLYERLMAAHVPGSIRCDLKPPAFLRLDPNERFPRVTVVGLDRGPAGLFGPFRGRKAAERARDALHKMFPLRPCDYSFEPDPELPLGLGCVYAQVRTCAAPCLARVSEEAYRALAAEAASFLARGAGRAEADWLPSWVSAIAGRRGLVVAMGRDGIELYPVREGSVLEARGVVTSEADLAASVGRLSWDAADVTPEDWPWLSAWLHDPRGAGTYLDVGDEGDLVELRDAVERTLAGIRSR
jgi:hypothetical protein